TQSEALPSAPIILTHARLANAKSRARATIGPRATRSADLHRSMSAAVLFRPRHTGLLHDLGPARSLSLDEAIELLGRTLADRDELKVDELLRDVGLGNGRIHGCIELADDVLRGAARDRDRLRGRPVEAGNPDLRERRNLRRRGDALCGRHAERTHLAGLH